MIMDHLPSFKILTFCLFELILIISSVCFDKIHVKDVVLRPLIDNISHGVIACLVWLTASSTSDRKALLTVALYETIVCGLFGCLIDVDHFLSAKSFSLHAATHLSHRPFGHALIVPMAVSVRFSHC